MTHTPQQILIPGGTGFLGKALEAFFSRQGHVVNILTRSPRAENHLFWDGKTVGDWVAAVRNADVIINLAGKSVDCRYNETNKHAILSSRIDSTRVLQEVISGQQNPPRLWINSSSATTYVHAEDELMTEATGAIGDDFSMSVCKAWEAAFFENEIPGTRKVAIRTSIVLGNGGGAFPKLRQITRLGLGGQQGKGTQRVSWIHLTDFCRAVAYIMEHEGLEGPVNVTAPNPIPNASFMQVLRKETGMGIGIPQPKPLLKLGAWMIGTETELLLKSRNVYPAKLLEAGFAFRFFNAELAISDLVNAL